VFIKKVVTGPIETNSYLVINNGKSVLIVDPSYGCEELISDVKQNHYIPDGIIITHGHFDHIMGIDEILKAFPGTAVYMHQKEQVMLRNADLNGSLMMACDGNTKELSKILRKVISVLAVLILK
jgi:glyoxylase-like metal-dependent hydrolase (beta-lactamase superfamily II)